jgi:DtxR family Mn-dependent transcriptional regulator
MPSVCETVSRLVEQGIVVRTARHRIELTPKGRLIAGQLKQRHEALLFFMIAVMAMEPGRADALACKIEHCIDKAFTDRILMLSEFLKHKHPDILKAVANHVRQRASTPPGEWSQFTI